MNRKNYLLASIFVVFAALTTGCLTTETKPAAEAEAAAAPDMGKVKTEIQRMETAWAAADNARDANGIAAFYAADAVSMSNNKPMVTGSEAILKEIEEGMAKRVKGATIAFDVLDVFGDENTVTEVGKTTGKDSTGKVTYTGKYMAIWAKRDGKYVCIRDISNDDVKEK
jgi:uncharacterized protein (TIGR02246 family)